MPNSPLFPPGPAAEKDRIVYDDDGLKRESSAPCQLNCPAGIDVPSYVALIALGRYEEAIEVIRRDNPFPWVCGLVCTNPCESWCQRRQLDKAICIKDLKGLAARMVMEGGPGYKIPRAENKFEEKVAVVGSGPAGLSVAYFLAWKGYRVTVFEAMPQPGGMLIAGIPEFRLPRHVVRREIEAIKAMGVEFVVNTPVGKDLTLNQLREDGYKAFFLGIGAWESVKLGIDEEDRYPQVISALDFLKSVSFGNRTKPADTVAIVGGGNAAVDTARTCVRLGCGSVSIVYRRTRAEMPAHVDEIIQMAEEGIQLHELTIPSRVIGSGHHVEALECVKAKLGEPDDSGRRRPIPIPDSNYRMPVGAIISAIGQTPAIKALPGLGDFELTRRGTIRVLAHNQQTNAPDVFAGGDAVTGPATVVQAIGAGKKAATAIHAFLRNEQFSDLPAPRPRTLVAPMVMDYHEKASIQRQEAPLIDLDSRMTTLDQVELGLDEKAAREEAKRCMRCDICERCGRCVEVCSERLGLSAIKFRQSAESSLILEDYLDGLPKCIGCGSCANICPTGALQMEDRDGERLILMSGTIINRITMEQCRGCGAYYVPAILVQHVGKLVGHPKELTDRKLCPECARIARAAGIAGAEPDFSRVKPTEPSVY